MNPNIRKIQEAIEPLRQQIINHPVYGSIENLDDLGVFYELSYLCRLGFYVAAKGFAE